jgi:hypothetical protein
MREIQPSELADILSKHELWLRGEPGSELANLSEANLSRANLSGANLSRANLSRANLSGAILNGANLWRANLREVNLSRAILREANLREVNLSGTNLSWASLIGANLSEANLSGANLSEANLSGANLNEAFGVYSMQLSKHPIVVWFDRESNTYMVKVGCMEYSIEHWLKHSESIGLRAGYSELQCEEYLIQFQAINRLIKLWTTGESK